MHFTSCKRLRTDLGALTTFIEKKCFFSAKNAYLCSRNTPPRYERWEDCFYMSLVFSTLCTIACNGIPMASAFKNVVTPKNALFSTGLC